jgi:hypothetical protein
MSRFPRMILTACVAVWACPPAAFALPGDAKMGPVSSPPDTVGPSPRIAPVEKNLIPTMQVALRKAGRREPNREPASGGGGSTRSRAGSITRAGSVSSRTATCS